MTTSHNAAASGGEVLMARHKKAQNVVIDREPPAVTAEDREDQLIALAFDVAEERLRDRSASNQLIAEIMRMGTIKERLQKEKLQRENEMLKAKTEAIESQKRTDQLYKEALEAMRIYSGYDGDRDYDDDEEDY